MVVLSRKRWAGRGGFSFHWYAAPLWGEGCGDSLGLQRACKGRNLDERRALAGRPFPCAGCSFCTLGESRRCCRMLCILMVSLVNAHSKGQRTKKSTGGGSCDLLLLLLVAFADPILPCKCQPQPWLCSPHFACPFLWLSCSKQGAKGSDMEK